MKSMLPLRDNRGGFALEATLLIMLLISVLIVIAFAGVVTTVRTANLDYRNSRVFYASEAGAEGLMAQLDNDLIDGILSGTELAALTPPVIPGFTIDSFSAVKVGTVVTEPITDGAYAGLYSLTQRMEITSSAVDPIGDRSKVIVSVKAQSIPIYQFGVFFEKDLEVTNGPAMTFGGWVHSNGNIYLSSNNAWYLDLITTPNKVYHDRKDYHNIYNGVYINNAVGTSVALSFDSRTQPTASGFKAASNAAFNNRLKTDAFKVDSLKMPLPLGMDPVEVLLPRKATDTPLMQQAKYSWKADWYIEVPIDQINAAGKNLCPTMTTVRAAGKAVATGGDCQKIFAFTWDGFFDAREKRYVDVLDIDVNELGNWVAKSPAANSTQILYVTFSGAPTGCVPTKKGQNCNNATTDPMKDGFRTVVRLINGSQLPNAMSVATDQPLYILGDYNSINWVGAALVGDALMIQSSAWNQNYTWWQTPAPGGPCPTAPGYTPALVQTTPLAAVCPGYVVPTANSSNVYAAVLAGHWATPCDHEVVGCAGGYDDFYGGGLENFPRFLENWGGKTLLFRGSLVSLHTSRNTLGTWNGSYYSPPARDWQFDTRFNDPNFLPPGTPVVGNVIHTAFRPVY